MHMRVESEDKEIRKVNIQPGEISALLTQKLFRFVLECLVSERLRRDSTCHRASGQHSALITRTPLEHADVNTQELLKIEPFNHPASPAFTTTFSAW